MNNKKYHKITQPNAGWGGVPPSPAWARQRPGQRWEQLQRQQLHHTEQRYQRVQRGGVRQGASSQTKRWLQSIVIKRLKRGLEGSCINVIVSMFQLLQWILPRRWPLKRWGNWLKGTKLSKLAMVSNLTIRSMFRQLSKDFERTLENLKGILIPVFSFFCMWSFIREFLNLS